MIPQKLRTKNQYTVILKKWVRGCLKFLIQRNIFNFYFLLLLSFETQCLIILLDHYSILADQEPLYQFYAADAARIASDFNSDGYEEVYIYIHIYIVTESELFT